MACVLIDADTSETSLAPLSWHYRRTSTEGNRRRKEKKKICKKCLATMSRSRFALLAQPCQFYRFALSQSGAHTKFLSFKYSSHNNVNDLSSCDDSVKKSPTIICLAATDYRCI